MLLINEFMTNQISHSAKMNMKHDIVPQEEAPPCTRMKGSYMAEAAAVLPFFATFMLFLLFFFRILEVQQAIGGALITSGRRLAVMSAAKEDKGTIINLISAEVIFQDLLRKEEAVSFVLGKNAGVSLIKSKFDKEHIILRADYSIKIPIGIFGIKKFTIHQCAKARKWTGQSIDETGGGLSEIVYITKNGTVYHRVDSCTYLKPSVKKVNSTDVKSMRNSSGGKYYGCSRCTRNSPSKVYVYITDYGNRYHSVSSCSELERMIYKISISEVGKRLECSKCGKDTK